MSDSDRIEDGKTYSSADVARIVFHRTGRQIDWFYTNKDRLIREEDFPRPITRFGWPKWSGRDLLAWMDRPKGTPANPKNPKVVDFSAMLRARATQVANRP
jgi:hypothetical protein